MDRMKLLLEAERRGLLPPEKQRLLAIARQRGIVPEPLPEKKVVSEPKQTAFGVATQSVKNVLRNQYDLLRGKPSQVFSVV